MNFIIVNLGNVIQNIICAETAFDSSMKPYYIGAEIGTVYNPPPDYEKLRADALKRISGKCSDAIESGIVVDGKRYLLRKYDDQNALTSALEKARNGDEIIPYKAVGDVLPQPYSAAQILKIAKTAEEWGQVNLSYRALLEVWRLRETDVDVLNSLAYGSQLPDDLMQELGENLAGFGIDITKYASMLTKTGGIK